jgi:hypothetical protein
MVDLAQIAQEALLAYNSGLTPQTGRHMASSR